MLFLLRTFAPFIDIPISNVKYLKMYKVQMHVGTISMSLYGFASVRDLIHSLKLVDYLPLQTRKPFNNLQLYSEILKNHLSLYLA